MMKQLFSVLSCAALLTLVSCGQSGNTSAEAQPSDSTAAVAARDTLVSMDGYQHTDTVTHRSQLYHYTIERQARPDLPTVQDEQGVTYIDNAVTLTLSRGDASPFFQRTYTKQSFATLLSSEFQKNGILAGFVYLRPVSQGLLFAATVCYPQRDSDFYEPFLVTISPEGVATVTKGNARDIEEPAHTDGMADGGVTDADGV